jgi:hypothetical protein
MHTLSPTPHSIFACRTYRCASWLRADASVSAMIWECCSRRRSRLSSGNVVRGEAADEGTKAGCVGLGATTTVDLPLCFCGIWGGGNMRPGPLKSRLSTQHPDQARWWPDQARKMARRRAISTRLGSARLVGAWANEILFFVKCLRDAWSAQLCLLVLASDPTQTYPTSSHIDRLSTRQHGFKTRWRREFE